MTTTTTNLTDDECVKEIAHIYRVTGWVTPHLEGHLKLLYAEREACWVDMNQAEQTADLGAFMDAEERLKATLPSWRRYKQLYLFHGGDLNEITGGR